MANSALSPGGARVGCKNTCSKLILIPRLIPQTSHSPPPHPHVPPPLPTLSPPLPLLTLPITVCTCCNELPLVLTVVAAADAFVTELLDLLPVLSASKVYTTQDNCK